MENQKIHNNGQHKEEQNGRDSIAEDLNRAEIEVLVCKAFSGEIVRASITLHETVHEALPSIADQIGYSSPDWEKIGLYNMTRDFEYRLEERFVDRGTQPGDLLFMADGTACHK